MSDSAARWGLPTADVRTTVSVPDELFHRAEQLARLLGKTRSEVYSEALADYVARGGKAIVDAYRRVPQDDDDLAWSDAASAAMIAEEPW